MVNNPKLGRFYLLPKIHKRLSSVPGRPVISNSGCFTENISAFLDHHLQPLAKKVRSYVKDTNDFLQKLSNVENIPQDAILCTIDVVGLYPSIPHDEGLEALRTALNSRENQSVSTDTLVELADLVLSNNFFEFNGDFLSKLGGQLLGPNVHHRMLFYFWRLWNKNFLNNHNISLGYGGVILMMYFWFGHTGRKNY